MSFLNRHLSPHLKSPEGFPVLSSMSFIILCFAFRSVIHFELIPIKDIRSVFTFIYSHVDVQLSVHHLLKRCLVLLTPSSTAFLFFQYTDKSSMY